MTSQEYSKLMNYALRLLSKRSYTKQGLTEKLEKRAHKTKIQNKGVIIEILERLTELKYINDLDFCERFFEERCRLRPRGKYLLSQELRKKGIPKETLEEFWGSERGRAFDENPLAQKLVVARLSRLDAELSTYEKREKLYRFLASRGFSVGTIRDVLDKTLNPY